jgi:hypothetical protein
VVTVAPVILNGLRGVRDLGIHNLHEYLRLDNSGHRRLGEDIIFWGDLA